MLARIEVEDGITDKICSGIIGILFKSKARLAAITRQVASARRYISIVIHRRLWLK
jgi:hypothetical protein